MLNLGILSKKYEKQDNKLDINHMGIMEKHLEGDLRKRTLNNVLNQNK